MKRPEHHEIDAAGQRQLRAVFEAFGWTVNKIENDYGADFEVELFESGVSTGAAFKVQLKSSRATCYTADGAGVSQTLRVANAKYLARELRVPTVLIHCDVAAHRTFWAFPQLDVAFAERLDSREDQQATTIHLSVTDELPSAREAFLQALRRADALLSARNARRVRPEVLADVGVQLKDVDGLIRTFQAHSDALRLREAYANMVAGDLERTFRLVGEVLSAPGSSIEDKVRAWVQWESAEMERLIRAEAHDWARIHASNHVARNLRALTRQGPRFLRYYAAILGLAANVGEDGYHRHALLLAKASVGISASPAVALAEEQLDRRIDLTLQRAARIVNRLISSPDAGALPIPLTRLANGLALLVLLREQEGRFNEARGLTRYGLDLCRAGGRIARRVGHDVGLASTCSAALLFSRREGDHAMCLANGLELAIQSDEDRRFVQRMLETRRRINRGEQVQGRIKTTKRQIDENVAHGLRFAENADADGSP
jgi:hypothetical protein